MREWAIINGALADTEQVPRRAFVYQRICTRGERLTAIALHCAHIRRDANLIFGIDIAPNSTDIEAQVAKLLRAGNYSTDLRHVAEWRIYGDGSYSIHIAETSPYDSFSLRLTRPRAVAVVCYDELPSHATSASAAQTEILREYAQRHEGNIVIQLHPDGRVVAIDGAPPIVVCGDEIWVAERGHSVAFELTVQALIERRGDKVRQCEITREMLNICDEIFFADERGLTAIGSFEGRTLADTIAYTTAQDIEKLL
jgi:hypothetical protein